MLLGKEVGKALLEMDRTCRALPPRPHQIRL